MLKPKLAVFFMLLIHTASNLLMISFWWSANNPPEVIPLVISILLALSVIALPLTTVFVRGKRGYNISAAIMLPSFISLLLVSFLGAHFAGSFAFILLIPAVVYWLLYRSKAVRAYFGVADKGIGGRTDKLKPKLTVLFMLLVHSVGSLLMIYFWLFAVSSPKATPLIISILLVLSVIALPLTAVFVRGKRGYNLNLVIVLPSFISLLLVFALVIFIVGPFAFIPFIPAVVYSRLYLSKSVRAYFGVLGEDRGE